MPQQQPTIYQRKGFRDRKHYLKRVASIYSLSEEAVFAVAQQLGHDEDFDGLISMCADESCGMIQEITP